MGRGTVDDEQEDPSAAPDTDFEVCVKMNERLL
jgi:hypothetical protein